VQFLPGVGPQRAILFERLGIVSLEHLMRHYPRTYLDARHFVPISDLEPGQLLTVDGVVKQAAVVRSRAGRMDFTCVIADASGRVGCYFFGQPFLSRLLVPGTRVVVSGEIDLLEKRMIQPLFEVVEGDVADLLHAGRLVPVHPLTKGLGGRAMRRAVRSALDGAGANVADPIPEEIRAARRLGPLAEALEHIHFPADAETLEQARRRLVFEELFLLQATVAVRRQVLHVESTGLASVAPGKLAGSARAALPFQLTEDQDRALAEIVADLRSPHPMQRMLLGDVGSGKTVVAALAALHVVECGRQAAFMAPTEILARQHAATLAAVAAPAGVAVAALTGATPAAERRALATRLAAGEPMIVAGTHALIVEKVELPGLALAIVDEQHRFGVKQRAQLARKGTLPDVLVLTATPIPRTLMLAFYGDLDVSRLNARPAGRGRLVTRIAEEEKFPQVLEFLARELGSGHQAYWVAPVIEEGARTETRAAESEFRRLKSHPLMRRFVLGLLHGRLKSQEKQEIMRRFVAGEIQMLVATTVIEVGVDIPNATVMVIQNADRFGLTQLHQLRGRVGRGTQRSVCVLMPGPAVTPLARERLDLLVRSRDGFALAEADLRMRGPGELWGTLQSGMPRLKIADLARDQTVLEEAQEAARGLVAGDPRLASPAHALLRETLLGRYPEPLQTALAG